MELNESQIEAVNASDGPLLIIAGAGSGKTRVLTERLARILEAGLAKPAEILTVTFTNKAAQEIQERVINRLKQKPERDFSAEFFGLTEDEIRAKKFLQFQAGGEVKDIKNLPWMGTFHSICLRLLRKHASAIGYNSGFSIYDPDDQVNLIKRVMKELNISTESLPPKTALYAISNAKNELVTPEMYERFSSGYHQANIAPIYTLYQKKLREFQAMDFDDLLVNAVLLFKNNPDLLEYYQEQFKYIMVDEYQDTNHAQYMLIKELSRKYANICVVGDDDQSIYAWRGANIRNILEFEKDFENVKIVKLEQNYRSTKKILTAGNGVVQGISKRKAKKLWTENPEGENITIYEALDERDEALWVANEIAGLLDAGVSPEEMAILYRMNAQSRIVEEVFLRAGIPHRIIGNVRFYERKEVKDILAYLKVIHNPADTISLLRIINVPSRKIGAKTVETLRQKAEIKEMDMVKFLSEYGRVLGGGLQRFAEVYADIANFAQNNNIVELLKYVFDRTGYLEMLRENTEENRQRIENLKELVNVASKFQEYSPDVALQAFLEEIALFESSDPRSKDQEDRDKVTLMTVHSAKGLEFENVFVLGAEEGIFPHSRSLNSAEELDEERRLAYVAITRAKKKLYISYAASRKTYGGSQQNVPSRFLNDIAVEIVNFQTYSYNYGGDDDSPWRFKATAPNKPRYNDSFASDEYADMDEYVLNVQAGDRVKHQVFGYGKIVSINTDIVVVEFDRSGRKELATEYANLVKM